MSVVSSVNDPWYLVPNTAYSRGTRGEDSPSILVTGVNYMLP